MPAESTLLRDLHDRLSAKLLALTTGEQWLAFLRSSRQFHRYSPQNQLLLTLQGAVGHVASYRTWQRVPAIDGGRCQVAKGQKGMVILAPITLARRDVDATGEETTVGVVTGFKPVKVFHQGQLVSPPALTDRPQPRLLTGDDRFQHVWAAVQTHLQRLGFDVGIVSLSPVESWNGRTDFADSHVVVADHLEPPARLKTLIHEWAHIALDHDDRLVGHRNLQEVEAESAAYLVCASIGVDSADYSVPYLAGWSNGDPRMLDATAQRVLAATADMVTSLEAELAIDLTPDLLQVTEDVAVARIEPAPRATQGALRVDRTSSSAPLLETAGGELRAVMSGLVGEGDRQRLLDALDDLDRQLPTAIELCGDAGLTAERTARFLLAHQVPIETLLPAMIRDDLEHHPNAPNVPPDEQRHAVARLGDILETYRATATTAETQRPTPIQPAGPVSRFSPDDFEPFQRFGLAQRQHRLAQALGHDDGGLDPSDVRTGAFARSDVTVGSTAHSIVREWADMRTNEPPTATPEMG